MQHREQYSGYTITVHVIPDGSGFVWSYETGRGLARYCQHRSLRTERLAMNEALSEAKLEIDGFLHWRPGSMERLAAPEQP